MGRFFIEHLFTNPWFFASWSLIVVFSICVHEYAHARVALARGDATAALSGHLTLNPLVQMGSASLVMLLLIGFAWGAVPVRASRFHRRSDAALIAFSGPASNLLLSAAAALLWAIAFRLTRDGASPILVFLRLAAQANGVLFVLNMLPAPMLDGWSVFASAFPAMEGWRERMGHSLSWIVLLLIFLTPLSSLIWRGGTSLADAFTLFFSRIILG